MPSEAAFPRGLTGEAAAHCSGVGVGVTGGRPLVIWRCAQSQELTLKWGLKTLGHTLVWTCRMVKGNLCHVRNG